MIQLLKNLLNEKPILCFAIAGLFTASAFLMPALWWIAGLGVLLFIYLLQNSPGYKQVIIGSFITGSIHFLIVLSWFWSTYPLDWLGLSGVSSAAVILFVWLSCSLVLALGKIVFGLVVYRYRSVSSYWFLLLAPLWLVSEMIGSVLFSVYTLGNGSRIGFEFSTGYLGYLLAEHGVLIRFAEFGGVFVLSVLYVVIAVCVYILLIEKKPLVATSAATLLLLTSFITYTNPYQDDSLSVIALSTDYTAHAKLEEPERQVRQDHLLQTISESLQQLPDYLLLPEDSRFSNQFADDDAIFSFLDAFAPAGVVLVDSTITNEDEGRFVVAKIFNSSTRKVDTIHKEYLIPTGEYLPHFHEFVIRLFGFGDSVDKFTTFYNYRAGSNNDLTLSEGAPAVLFCFEAVSSTALYKAAKLSNAPFVAHPVSHAWFNDSWLLRHQLQQNLAVNALFAKTSVYMASNQWDAMRF